MSLPRTTIVRRYLLVMSVLTIAAVLASLALRSGVRARSGERAGFEGMQTDMPIGHIEPFQLTDQTGAVFSSKSFAGKYYVTDFIFTSCAGICPVMTGAMAGLYREFGDSDAIRFVSISVDPETDTPEHLAEYGARFGADPAKWKFLTGEMPVIEKLARTQFLQGFGDEPVQHSPRFILVDGHGDIQGFFDGTDGESVADLRSRLAEIASQSPAQQ